ncbi:MAG: type II secretion system F family protein [Gemmataceae bacterium]
MKPEDLVTLNEEIAGMARAGLPLDQGLSALALEMGHGKLQKVTARLADDLRSGITLPEALERQGDRVPPYYAGLVQAGIRAGRISDVLATLTTYARSLSDLRATVINALFYPGLVLLFSAILFAFMCLFIMPQFQQIFRDFNMRLPLITELAFTIGTNPIQMVVIPVLVLLGLVWGVHLLMKRTETGRALWTRVVYSMPIVGVLVRSTRLSAFSELLAILVDHGVPLPEGFRLAGLASSDPLLTEAGKKVEKDLEQGVSLGKALREKHLVPELIAWMTGMGEQRGNLGQTLHQVAAIYHRQAELRANLLRNVLPPILILATASIIVFFFVIAIMLPMVKLLEALSK